LKDSFENELFDSWSEFRHCFSPVAKIVVLFVSSDHATANSVLSTIPVALVAIGTTSRGFMRLAGSPIILSRAAERDNP
jgi:hypothetical protein